MKRCWLLAFVLTARIVQTLPVIEEAVTIAIENQETTDASLTLPQALALSPQVLAPLPLPESVRVTANDSMTQDEVLRAVFESASNLWAFSIPQQRSPSLHVLNDATDTSVSNVRLREYSSNEIMSILFPALTPHHIPLADASFHSMLKHQLFDRLLHDQFFGSSLARLVKEIWIIIFSRILNSATTADTLSINVKFSVIVGPLSFAVSVFSLWIGLSIALVFVVQAAALSMNCSLRQDLSLSAPLLFFHVTLALLLSKFIGIFTTLIGTITITAPGGIRFRHSDDESIMYSNYVAASFVLFMQLSLSTMVFGLLIDQDFYSSMSSGVLNGLFTVLILAFVDNFSKFTTDSASLRTAPLSSFVLFTFLAQGAACVITGHILHWPPSIGFIIGLLGLPEMLPLLPWLIST